MVALVLTNQIEVELWKENKHKMMESVQAYNSTNVSLPLQTVILNESSERRDYLIEQFSYNRKIDEPYYSILIALYSFLIIFGSTGNIMVVLAVLRNKQMQTARWLIKIKMKTKFREWKRFYFRLSSLNWRKKSILNSFPFPDTEWLTIFSSD